MLQQSKIKCSGGVFIVQVRYSCEMTTLLHWAVRWEEGSSSVSDLDHTGMRKDVQPYRPFHKTEGAAPICTDILNVCLIGLLWPLDFFLFK